MKINNNRSDSSRMNPCPLCYHKFTGIFHQDKTRTYHRCPKCILIFVDRLDLLTPEEEKTRYDLHQNDPIDTGYRKHLNQLAEPLLAHLGPKSQKGLDFGSGPGPTLSLMLKEAGQHMTLYDPFYAPHSEVLREKYDFVTCTETVEHFHNPGQEWHLLTSLVKPGGWLGIMTSMINDLALFRNWYYKDDDTHVCFYSEATFQFLATRDHLSVEIINDNVILFQIRK